MRKKLIAAIVLAALLATGLGTALAAPGTTGDPFVTLSYLTNTYAPQLEQAMLEQAQKATGQIEQAALEKLAALSGSYLAQVGGTSYSDAFQRRILAGGDRLSLPAGASLLFESGKIALSVSGTVLDVTTGSALPDGSALTAGHRYVVAENSTCVIHALSDSVYLSVQGNYTLDSTGAPQTPFIDITITDWHRPYVRYAYENGLFQGVTTTTFGPSTNMNRAMLVTVLSRLAGAGSVETETRFSDVPAGSWYENAVNWAASEGIVNGMDPSNKLFAPNVNVTREQMAVMLYRYAQDYLGMQLTASGDLSVFSDRGLIESWAEPAMSWAVGSGIMTGYTNGTLGPNGQITRAEVAAMLQRFITFLNQ